MTNHTLKTFALSLVPACMAGLIIQACGGSSDAVAQASDADPVEGVWESSVTIRDCTSGATTRTFKGLTVLHRGGTTTGVNNQPPMLNGPALGTWKRDASRATLTASYRFFRFNADGSFAGAQKLTRTLTPSADGASMTGTISAQILDPSDNVLQTICGTEQAARVS
jgi:hypothetical protein